MTLLIKNGRVIDPATERDGIYDILIVAGKIKEIDKGITAKAENVIDASGLIVSPGFIDIHVHLREPGQEHKEDIESGSRSAVRGGFTSIACMPNTSPINDNLDVTGHIMRRAKEVGLVNIFPVAAVSQKLGSKTMTDMDALVKAGVRGFSDDGRCVMSESIFKEALIRARELGVPVMEHCEDHTISKNGQVNEGAISDHCELKGIPAASEDVIIERDLRLQEEVDSYLHLTHLSTEGGVNMIREARQRGISVTSDVTPHHLLLDDEVIRGCDPMYKMKPPLRSASDREAMVQGIKDGTIDCIATDHAPHSPEEKARSFEKAPFGVIGLETSFPVVYDRLVKSGEISLKQMIRLFSTNGAWVLGLEGRGELRPGSHADITILDLEKPFTIKAEHFESKSVNCPFLGWTGTGTVAYTIVSGKLVYKSP